VEDGQELVAGITQMHMNAVTSILYFYEQYLWRFTAPSKRRAQQILEVQLLLIKIQLVSSSKIGRAINALPTNICPNLLYPASKTLLTIVPIRPNECNRS